MPDDISLHYFLRPDHAEISDLWVASWTDTFPQIDFGRRRDWLFNHLEDLHDHGAQTTCAIERSTGTIAGFVTVNPDTGWLDQFAVAPTARGSGLATRLMDEAKRISPQRIELDVNAGNERAIRFYRREGFAKYGEGVNPSSGMATWKMRWQAGPRGTSGNN